MGLHSFNEVFSKINLSQKQYERFNNCLVKNVTIKKQTRNIEIRLLSESFISHVHVMQLGEEILEHFSYAKTIDLDMIFDLPFKDDSATLVTILKNDICGRISMSNPIKSSILNIADWSIERDKIKISLKSNNSFLLRQSGIDKRIEEILKNNYALYYKVMFADGSEEMPENTFDYRELIAANYSDKPETANEKPKPAAVAVKPSGVVLGKPIKGSATSVMNAKTQGEKIIVECIIISIDKRDIKGNKCIVIMDITDFSDSTTVKFFVKQEKYKEIGNRLAKNNRIRVEGEVQYDKYSNEINLIAKNIESLPPLPEKMDEADNKRVELHLHTQMSQMDGMTDVKDYIARAAKWGHKAVAVTDHGVVQAFPDAMDAAQKHGIKVIYGMEGYLVDDIGSVVQMAKNQTFDDTFVVFDIETTGLYKERDRITEIGAVKIKNGCIVDRFSTFVDPNRPIPPKIVELTGITDEMVKGAPSQRVAVTGFLDFVGDSVIAAHNAGFDMGFINHVAAKKNIYPKNTVIDTVELSRTLFPELSRYKLDDVCRYLDIELRGHHRAVNDAEATAEILIKSFEIMKNSGVKGVSDINVFASQNTNFKKMRARHVIIIAKNQKGLKSLYELVSESMINYFFKRPRILKSILHRHRENLLIGSACEAGELFTAVLEDKPVEVIKEIADFYDYFEVQPLENNRFLIEKGVLSSVDSLIEINKKIIELGEELNKPVVATCDVHFMDPEDEIFRRIIQKGDGYSDADKQPPLYFRTTNEMLAEFNYLTPEKAHEIVIENTNKIADMTEDLLPIPKGVFPPQINGSEDELRKIVMDKAHFVYGEALPVQVKERLDKELDSIIKNGFSVMYIIAQKLVWNSVENGYLVGSRGSVGSSFAATMAGITEVNPLPPHYVCEKCKYSDFESDTVISFAGGSGCDMPDKLCPNCESKLKKDGHDIPFETFLGFDGDKEPDIDLNFSGEYQQLAHTYTEELFGSSNVFKAGTISKLAEKTAFGYVKKYFEEKGITKHNAEINRLVKGCTGVKRTTGQHPGGLMVVPRTENIYNFTPIQRPANDINSNITTTHFDYHSISGRLLKLDLLGHDDPTVIRMLHDITGENPQDAPLDDEATMSLFTSPKALEVTLTEIDCHTGTLGLPEFGTGFVRQMLMDTKPKAFAELVRISGLSHGTDVWLNNAQDYVRSGTAKLSEIISTRDDIMVYLIIKGVEKKAAFKIMEKVRKGKEPLSEDDIAVMKENNVPDWYIDSCNKIKYMFPKAHAAAYTMMAFRIAYFKVHYPIAFYASYFTVRADDFDYVTMCKGQADVLSAIKEMNEKGNALTAKEKSKLTVLEVVYEMYKRGFDFLPLDLYKSDAKNFIVEGSSILPPFNSLPGLGDTAAVNIMDARKDGEFPNIEDLKQRTGLSKTVIELLKSNGILDGMPMTSQLTLF